METTTDERGKTICAATPQFFLLLVIMANVVVAQNTTDPAEGLASSSLYVLFFVFFPWLLHAILSYSSFNFTRASLDIELSSNLAQGYPRLVKVYVSWFAPLEYVDFIVGELCSGAAVDSTDFDSQAYNPAIKCDCTFPNSTCHIIRLRFEGNSFEGSIPPSFSRLTSLQELRITGLRNGTLDFITNLKSLTVLLLRNNRITGSIPSDIGEYQNLTRLFEFQQFVRADSTSIVQLEPTRILVLHTLLL
ncbi:probable LRR receptor-like serine/threonine-protein kinase [Tanacetum coccineum]